MKRRAISVRQPLLSLCALGLLMAGGLGPAGSSVDAGQARAAGPTKPDISVLLATHMQAAGASGILAAAVTVIGQPGGRFGLEVASAGSKTFRREGGAEKTIPPHGSLVTHLEVTGNDAGIYYIRGYVTDKRGTTVYTSPAQEVIWARMHAYVDAHDLYLGQSVQVRAELDPGAIYTGYTIELVVYRVEGGKEVEMGTQECAEGVFRCVDYITSPAEKATYRNIVVRARIHRPFLETQADKHLGLNVEDILNDPSDNTDVAWKAWNLTFEVNGKSGVTVNQGAKLSFVADSDLNPSVRNPLKIYEVSPSDPTRGKLLGTCTTSGVCTVYRKAVNLGDHTFVALVRGDPTRKEPLNLKKSDPVTVKIEACAPPHRASVPARAAQEATCFSGSFVLRPGLTASDIVTPDYTFNGPTKITVSGLVTQIRPARDPFAGQKDCQDAFHYTLPPDRGGAKDCGGTWKGYGTSNNIFVSKPGCHQIACGLEGLGSLDPQFRYAFAPGHVYHLTIVWHGELTFQARPGVPGIASSAVGTWGGSFRISVDSLTGSASSRR